MRYPFGCKNFFQNSNSSLGNPVSVCSQPDSCWLMARPWSVKSVFGKRPTSTSVRPLFTARLMMAAARLSRSSSDTPEGPCSLSSKAFFSASTAACLRICSEAFSASTNAIFLLQSEALGSSSSTFDMTVSPKNSPTTWQPGQLPYIKGQSADFDLSQGALTVIPSECISGVTFVHRGINEQEFQEREEGR